jgi:hypothetical protein
VGVGPRNPLCRWEPGGAAGDGPVNLPGITPPLRLRGRLLEDPVGGRAVLRVLEWGLQTAGIDSGGGHLSDEVIAAPGWQRAFRGAEVRRR